MIEHVLVLQIRSKALRGKQDLVDAVYVRSRLLSVPPTL